MLARIVVAISCFAASALELGQAIPFTELKSAKVLVQGQTVRAAKDGGIPQVVVEYGSNCDQLLKNSDDNSEENITAFASVEWRAPGGSLSQEAIDKAIEAYVGSYAKSFDVNHRLMRGLSPLVSSDREWLALANIQWVTVGPRFPAIAMGGSIDWAEYVQEVLNYTVDLAAALNELPDVEATTWRGSLELAETVAGWKHDGEVRLPGFASTTTNGEHAKEFLGSKVGFAKQGLPVLFKIHSKRLKDLRKWNPNEAELILLPFSHFRITAFEEQANFTQITLEEELGSMLIV